MIPSDISKAIIEICHNLHERNLLAAGDGNISHKISDDRIAITPRGKNKHFIHEKDLAIVTLDNRVITGEPSSERKMHLEIYRQCPKAVSVVHAHPPHAIAWTVAKPTLTELPSHALPELILATGKIPIVPYARPSTEEMGLVLHPFLPHHRVMILARHGAVSWGETLIEAYNGMERVEHAAQILFYAQQLGRIAPMTDEELRSLKAMRRDIGDKIL